MRKMPRPSLPLLAALLVLIGLALTGCGGDRVLNGGQVRPPAPTARALATLEPNQPVQQATLASPQQTGVDQQPTSTASDVQDADQVDQDLDQIQNDLNQTDTLPDFK